MLFIALFMALINGFTAAANLNLTNFYLVTTTSPAYFNNPAALPDVSALSLFNPYHTLSYALRLIGPGYNSLPTFSLSINDTLYTEATGPHGQGYGTYYSNNFRDYSLIQFWEDHPGPKPGSGDPLLSLQKSDEGKGVLLAVDGFTDEVWAVCDGDLGLPVIVYKGTGGSCQSRYIQAVEKPPY